MLKSKPPNEALLQDKMAVWCTCVLQAMFAPQRPQLEHDQEVGESCVKMDLESEDA